MLQHNLTLAWRQLVKYRLQSAVSIVSLAIGFACFALASMWIKYETTYDGFHKDADEIYCLMRTDRSFSGGRMAWASTIPVTDSIIAHCPEIETYVAFSQSGNLRRAVSAEDDSLYIDGVYELECDNSFFDFFAVRFLAGDENFLQEDDKVAVTQETARRLWGNENPIGKRLRIGFDKDYVTVAAVVEGWGEHTSIRFSIIRNLSKQNKSGWTSYRKYAFRLHPHVDVERLNEKLVQMPRFNLADPNPMELDCTWSLLSLPKLHNVEAEWKNAFKLNHIYLFSIAGGLLILCGLLNYLTMFLNRLFIRQREMVLRSVFGATAWQLMVQFLTEYGLLLAIALFFGNYATKVSLNWFLKMAGLPDNWNYFHHESLFFMLLVVVVSLFISCPPIWYFRRQSVQQTFQGRNGLFTYSNFRKFSTCLQLCIAIFCIFCTIVLQKQLDELRHGDIGFDHERTVQVIVSQKQGFEDEREAFLHYLRQQPEIETIFNGCPLYPQGPGMSFFLEKKNEVDMNREEAAVMAYYDKDGELSRFHNLRLLQGRLLQPGDSQTDVVINESAARLFDWDTPLGKRIVWEKYTVIGVVKDFQNNGPTMPCQPAMLLQREYDGVDAPDNYMLRYSAGEWKDHQKKYEEYLKNSGSHLYVYFQPVAESFNAALAKEDKLQTLLSITTSVCILIALFGVWSMIMLTCEQRRKEIAIRKVYGATVKDILDMFFLEYMALQAIAALVAFPIGYACMKPWLEQYVVQTEISWWIYVGIFLLVALLVALCIGWRVWKTATARPADEICKG